MTQSTVNQKPKPREARWPDIYTQLQEDKVEFFVNTHLEPTVLIPSDGFQTEWPVDSQRFQDLLVSVFYEISNGGILKSNERDFLLAQIREECRKGGRRLTEPEAVETDEDVIVQAILLLANSMSKNATAPVFNDRTVVLLQRLQGFQRDGTIPCFQEIPIFTNIFSRRLTRLIPVLLGYGVQIDLSHAEDGSRCKLTRLETFKFEPSAGKVQPSADGWKSESSDQSSGTTSMPGKDLAPADDTDGDFRSDPPRTTDGTTDLKDVAGTKKGGAK